MRDAPLKAQARGRVRTHGARPKGPKGRRGSISQPGNAPVDTPPIQPIALRTTSRAIRLVWPLQGKCVVTARVPGALPQAGMSGPFGAAPRCRRPMRETFRVGRAGKLFPAYLAGNGACAFELKYPIRSRTCSFVRGSSCPSGIIESGEMLISSMSSGERTTGSVAV